MLSDLLNPDVLIRFAINLVAMTVLVFGMFYMFKLPDDTRSM